MTKNIIVDVKTKTWKIYVCLNRTPLPITTCPKYHANISRKTKYYLSINHKPDPHH